MVECFWILHGWQRNHRFDTTSKLAVSSCGYGIQEFCQYLKDPLEGNNPPCDNLYKKAVRIVCSMHNILRSPICYTSATFYDERLFCRKRRQTSSLHMLHCAQHVFTCCMMESTTSSAKCLKTTLSLLGGSKAFRWAETWLLGWVERGKISNPPSVSSLLRDLVPQVWVWSDPTKQVLFIAENYICQTFSLSPAWHHF